MLLKLLFLVLWMLVVPFGMGLAIMCTGKNHELKEGACFTVALGYMAMWSLFELVCVPFVIREGSFFTVEKVFALLAGVLALLGYALFVKKLVRKGDVLSDCKKNWSLYLARGKEYPVAVCLWLVFIALVGFQMLMAYKLAYGDGDDAYYNSVSTAANLGGRMYMHDAYIGNNTTLDIRHGLAPFPIWVSFIAAMCQVNAAVAAHSLMQPVLILMTYLIYVAIGRVLMKGKEEFMPLFLIFTAFLQIYGNYSVYPASTFLLTRARQGKEAFGNMILPFILLLFLYLGREFLEKGRLQKKQVLMLALTSLAGCLCSTMSGMLLCMLSGIIGGLFILLSYRGKGKGIGGKERICFAGNLLLGMLPGIGCTVLYLVLR